MYRLFDNVFNAGTGAEVLGEKVTIYFTNSTFSNPSNIPSPVRNTKPFSFARM